VGKRPVLDVWGKGRRWGGDLVKRKSPFMVGEGVESKKTGEEGRNGRLDRKDTATWPYDKKGS